MALFTKQLYGIQGQGENSTLQVDIPVGPTYHALTFVAYDDANQPVNLADDSVIGECRFLFNGNPKIRFKPRHLAQIQDMRVRTTLAGTFLQAQVAAPTSGTRQIEGVLPVFQGRTLQPSQVCSFGSIAGPGASPVVSKIDKQNSFTYHFNQDWRNNEQLMIATSLGTIGMNKITVEIDQKSTGNAGFRWEVHAVIDPVPSTPGIIPCLRHQTIPSFSSGLYTETKFNREAPISALAFVDSAVAIDKVVVRVDQMEIFNSTRKQVQRRHMNSTWNSPLLTTTAFSAGSSLLDNSSLGAPTYGVIDDKGFPILFDFDGNPSNVLDLTIKRGGRVIGTKQDFIIEFHQTAGTPTGDFTGLYEVLDVPL